MSDRRAKSNSSPSKSSSSSPMANADNVGLVSMKMKKALTGDASNKNGILSSEAADSQGTKTALSIISMLIGLAYIGIQIYILYYTFMLERIGCACATDFRRTYAQAYIIVSLVLYIASGVLTALTNNENERIMVTVKAIINGVMFIAGLVYVVFVWQYIAKLRRIKCACSTSLARDVWEVVNYIQIAMICLVILLTVIAMVSSASLYSSIVSTSPSTK